MFDEGAESLEVTRLLRGLQHRNPGRVHVLMGNHEIILLRALSGVVEDLNWETTWSWARRDDDFTRYLRSNGVPEISTEEMQSCFQRTYRETGVVLYPDHYTATAEQVSAEIRRNAARRLKECMIDDGTYQWISQLPAGIKIENWVFFHGGPPGESNLNVPELNKTIWDLVDSESWDDPRLAPYGSIESPMSTRNWAAEEQRVDQFLDRYDVDHIAFGHSPGALNGTFGVLCQKWGKVFKADSYIPLGIEGNLEIRDECVWAIYSDCSIENLFSLYPVGPSLNQRHQLK